MKMSKKQASDFAMFLAHTNDIDFKTDGGMIVVYNNAVIILRMADDGVTIKCEMAIGDYERIEVDVVHDEEVNLVDELLDEIIREMRSGSDDK